MKDKPKEKFATPPTMPPDIKELNRQREREMVEERVKAGNAAGGGGGGGGGDTTPEDTPLSGGDTGMRPGNVTLPPGPGERDEDKPPKSNPNPDRPKSNPNGDNVPTKPATRPREVEGPTKRGKRGDDEP